MVGDVQKLHETCSFAKNGVSVVGSSKLEVYVFVKKTHCNL